MWNLVTKVAFRFCVIYFGLFCLWFAQITYAFAGVLALWLPPGAVMWQMLVTDPVNSWVGRTVFGIDAAIRRDSGSGDQAAIWVSILCLLIIAVLGTALWSVLDRRRTDYARQAVWFTVFLRLCLGGQMLFYGFAKLIPTQMPTPPLAALVQPLGEFSPMSMLWLQVGTSHPYEMALGAVEVTAGLLLFWPRTAMLGALLSLLSMGQVFLLNMAFDVPVKILSFHLMLISIVLLAPHLRRLVDVLVRHRAVQPAPTPRLFASDRSNRIATAVEIGLGVWISIGLAVMGWQAWHEYGDGRDKPELYGIWTVTDFRVDDRQAPPLTTDRFRWQRIIFDKEGVVTIQWMDGDLRDAPLQFEPGRRHLRITTPLPKPDGVTAPAVDPAEFAEFDFTRPAPDRLELTGTVQGRPVTMELESIDLESFPLRNRGFHWVQEYPYMR
ncbi:DoxX family protein [Mycolicibacterium sp. PDY-3]|uniref:DoxX family protein n=1 Tax=Mycolicibacterium sp. PDY-3 TaxID=3376069 RepID=UPI003797B768